MQHLRGRRRSKEVAVAGVRAWWFLTTHACTPSPSPRSARMKSKVLACQSERSILPRRVSLQCSVDGRELLVFCFFPSSLSYLLPGNFQRSLERRGPVDNSIG